MEKPRICKNCIYYDKVRDQGFCCYNLPQPLVGPPVGGLSREVSINFFDLAVRDDRTGCVNWKKFGE